MKKILLIGEGGQGVQTIAKILAQAAQQSGKFTSYIPSFGVEQRGGVSLAFIQISDEEIGYPRFAKADLVVLFCNRAVEAAKNYITRDTLVIYDNSAIENSYLTQISSLVQKAIGIPAQKVAKEKYSTRVLNTLILGTTVSFLEEVNRDLIENLLLEGLKSKIDKKPEIKELNLNALNEGFTLAKTATVSNKLTGIEPPKIETKFENNKIKWERFPKFCKGCAICIFKCPVKALSFSNDLGFLGNPMPVVDLDKCIGCGMCQKMCPDGAINVENK